VPAQPNFCAFPGRIDFEGAATFEDQEAGPLEHLVDLAVVVRRVVMEEEKFFGPRLEGE
jgi:hypothetical protein